MCRVVNRHKEKYDIYIGRGTVWGNPYKDMPRAKMLALFRVYFLNKVKSGEITIDQLKSLQGKRLGCSCFPKPCHGDFIVRVVNKVCGIKESNLDFLE